MQSIQDIPLLNREQVCELAHEMRDQQRVFCNALFAIPGTGSHFVNSALNRDYTLALGVTILYTALVYALNLAVDLAYALLDPRIRYS